MLISKNSYLILGLNSDSDDKTLNKRYKELLNFLNIDEVGSYDNDFGFIGYGGIRSEDNIKEAFQNLSNQHKKIYQTFFWFQIVDDNDEKCLNDIMKGKYIEGSNKWLGLFEKTKKYHYLKNHIIAELLFFENKNKFKGLSFTDVPSSIVNLLYQLINSDSFRKEFKEIFNIQNEIPVRDDMIISFKNGIIQFIAEAFFDLSEELGNSKLYKEFSKKFGVSAKDLDDNKNVTEKMKNIEETLDCIKGMSLSEELDDVIDGLNGIISEIKNIDKLGLANNPKIIKLKDETAREMRNMAISLFNDYDDSDNAINFIEEAKKVVHSNSLKEKLNKDLEDMTEQGEKTEMFKSILDLQKEGQEYFSNNNYKSAEKIYSGCIKLIVEELSEKFDLDTIKLNLLISKIEDHFNMISLGGKTTESVINNIDNMKKLVKEDGGFSWGDDLNFGGLGGDQRLLLMILIDAVAYRKMSDMLGNKKTYQSNSTGESKFPWWIIWVVIAIISAIAKNS